MESKRQATNGCAKSKFTRQSQPYRLFWFIHLSCICRVPFASCVRCELYESEKAARAKLSRAKRHEKWAADLNALDADNIAYQDSWPKDGPVPNSVCLASARDYVTAMPISATGFPCASCSRFWPEIDADMLEVLVLEDALDPRTVTFEPLRLNDTLYLKWII